MKANFNNGIEIRNARKKAGISQRKLAEKSHISESEICAYENNRRRPGIEKYAAIAKALNISIDELYYGDAAAALSSSRISEGETIAQCIRILWEKGIASLDPATADDERGGTFRVRMHDGITLKKYPHEIMTLLEKFETYATDIENLPDPEPFLEQIMMAGAKAIDVKIADETVSPIFEDEDVPF